MELELECGDPKSSGLNEHDLSALHQMNARQREYDRRAKIEWEKHLIEVEKRNKAEAERRLKSL